MLKRYRVRREFWAAGALVAKGTIVVDPPWKNTAALAETGYLELLVPEDRAPVERRKAPAGKNAGEEVAGNGVSAAKKTAAGTREGASAPAP